MPTASQPSGLPHVTESGVTQPETAAVQPRPAFGYIAPQPADGSGPWTSDDEYMQLYISDPPVEELLLPEHRAAPRPAAQASPTLMTQLPEHLSRWVEAMQRKLKDLFL